MTAGNNTHRKTSSATDSATDSTQRQSNPSGYTTSAGERAAGKARERLITRDVALIMAATFFYMTSSMMGTPIIAGFSQSARCKRRTHGLPRRRTLAQRAHLPTDCRPIFRPHEQTQARGDRRAHIPGVESGVLLRAEHRMAAGRAHTQRRRIRLHLGMPVHMALPCCCPSRAWARGWGSTAR